MKTARFLSAAAFAAIAFTLFACSNDDPDDNTGGGGVNPSELSNKQVYFVNYSKHDGISKIGESNDNGDIFLSIEYKVGENWETDKIPAGKILNGKLLLDSLPSIGSKYSTNFEKFSGRCESDEAESRLLSCQGTLSYPQDISIYWDSWLSVDIPGKDCGIGIYMVKSDKWSEGVGFNYFSKGGKITGTETYSYEEGETNSVRWDMSFSEGWNLYYEIEENNNGWYVTNNRPSGTVLEWGLDCY